MPAYYNENNAKACHILRHMIKTGVIADGVVDDRSIELVEASDLKGFTQCHFFAGGGFWSIAARWGGWHDDRPIWTASCPCQPFSNAGRRQGTSDKRHLWPHLFRIVRAARLAGFGPPVIMGEQVTGQAGYDWFHGIRTDLETEGYRARTIDFPACSINAPHQRNRQYWCALADADQSGWEVAGNAERVGTTGGRWSLDQRSGSNDFGIMADREGIDGRTGTGRLYGSESGDLFGPIAGSAMADAEGGFSGRIVEGRRPEGRTIDRRFDAERGSSAMDYAIGAGREGFVGHGVGSDGSPVRSVADRPASATDGCGDGSMGDRDGRRWSESRLSEKRRDDLFGFTGSDGRTLVETIEQASTGHGGRLVRAVAEQWIDANWIVCHDGKKRRTKPGIRLLANGISGRVDLWGVAGNAIVPQAAALAIEAIREVLDA